MSFGHTGACINVYVQRDVRKSALGYTTGVRSEGGANTLVRRPYLHGRLRCRCAANVAEFRAFKIIVERRNTFLSLIVVQLKKLMNRSVTLWIKEKNVKAKRRYIIKCLRLFAHYLTH